MMELFFNLIWIEKYIEELIVHRLPKTHIYIYIVIGYCTCIIKKLSSDFN